MYDTGVGMAPHRSQCSRAHTQALSACTVHHRVSCYKLHHILESICGAHTSIHKVPVKKNFKFQFTFENEIGKCRNLGIGNFTDLQSGWHLVDFFGTNIIKCTGTGSVYNNVQKQKDNFTEPGLKKKNKNKKHTTPFLLLYNFIA